MSWEKDRHYWREFWQNAPLERNGSQDAAIIKALDSVVDEVSSFKKPTVIDIGCGDGARLAKLASECPKGVKFIGVDVSEEALNRAQAETPSLQTFLVDDAPKLPGRSVAAIYSVAVCQLVSPPAWVDYMREANRVLRKHGLLVFQFVDATRVPRHVSGPQAWTWGPSEMEQVLKSIGFSVVDIFHAVQDSWAWVIARKT
jgi:cyclopropane fatty-acyl-phospholipid synthase-like methyltransferase